MRTRRRSTSLLPFAFGLVVVLVGCPATAPGTPSNDGGHGDGSASDSGQLDGGDVDASACVALSQPCTTSTECCSGSCGPNDTCWPATCLPTSEPCTLDIECCTLSCEYTGFCN